MTKELIGAFTKPGANYPSYINASREDGRVILTVRGDPMTIQGVYVCGYDRDKGQPGRCTPGDDHCNNYCNMAPEKGPMQDRANPCVQVIEAKTVTISLSPEEWDSALAALNGG